MEFAVRIVDEIIDGFPTNRPVRTIKRDEKRFFDKPDPALMRFVTADVQPLGVYKFISKYEPVRFSPPRGVFEGPFLRLEWQTINGRQPFYHRNADVDEIGFQICGERTQLTELGTVELRPGQFSSIPVGVGHDNYGREDIHLIFYLHGPVEACVPPVELGEYKTPPFPGWEQRPMLEISTLCLGGPHCDVAYSVIDESLLLQAATRFEEKMAVLEAPATTGHVEWIYKAPRIWIGHTNLEPSGTRSYTRHLCADEIQYQVSGRRTLITQRGIVELEAGEFVCIPLGCAFASISQEPSQHVSLLTSENTPAVCEPDRFADMDFAGFLDRLNLTDAVPA